MTEYTENVAVPEQAIRLNDFIAEIVRVFPHAGVMIDPEDGQVIVGTFFRREEGTANVVPMVVPDWVGTTEALRRPLPHWQRAIREDEGDE